MNGTYNNSILLREYDSTYIFIPNCEIKIINSTNFVIIYNIFNMELNTELNKRNVYIDNQLEYVIAYSIYKFGDETIIYNSKTRELINIWDYMSKYNITSINLSIYYVKKFTLLLLFIKLFLNATWNIRSVINVITNKQYDKKHDNRTKLSMDYIIDILDTYNEETCIEEITEVRNIIKNFFTVINSNNPDIMRLQNKRLLKNMNVIKALTLLNDEHFIISF